MEDPQTSRRSKQRRIIVGSVSILVILLLSLVFIFSPSWIRRVPFSAPDASYHSWDEILQNPQPITVEVYNTGTNQTTLSGLMNMDHERAANIPDENIDIPILVFVIHHQDLGAYLIDAGFDKSWVHSPYGTVRGVLVPQKMAQGWQEPGMDTASIIEQQNIALQGVFLTHLHMDHTGGIVDLPKDIPYVLGKGEPYFNFRFLIQGDHLKGIDQLYELDFSTGIDLPPLGRGIDVFGDGSFWAIDASGHSKALVIYMVNGVERQVLLTGDACNIELQFDVGVGPGSFSADMEKGQDTLDRIILFAEQYPEVELIFGHDLQD
jgi:glyoxylase-like metal-dependent hydrolase (beta-lactamase superfamily II)